MAPPKVDLNGKEKPTDVPAAIVVDQTSELNRHTIERQLAHRRRRCRAITVLLVLGVVIVGAALAIMVARRHHRSHFKRFNFCGTKNVPENVKIDYGKNLIYVNNTKTEGFSATHALHDYSKKVSAFRDPEHKRCFLEPLHKSFDDGVKEWDTDEDKKDKPEHSYHAHPEMAAEDARRYWGDAVADHCKGHKFHMMRMLPDNRPPHHEEIKIMIKIASNDAIRIIFIDIRT